LNSFEIKFKIYCNNKKKIESKKFKDNKRLLDCSVYKQTYLMIKLVIAAMLFISCTKFTEKEVTDPASLKKNDHIKNISLKSNNINEGLISAGPFAGGVTETSATLIVKPVKPALIRFQLSLDSGFSVPFYTEEIPSDKNNYNYTKIEIKDLTADTKYFYRAVIDGYLTELTHYFNTFSTDKKKDFSFGFGSCQQGRSASTPDVFPVIGNDSIKFFIHLGDWTYPDYRIARDFNTNWDQLEQSYMLKYDPAYPFVTDVLSKMPIAYVYDDHEYAGNDADGTNPFKSNSIKAYSMFFPHYKLENPDNGIWQKFRYGDVEFFILDLRSQRSSNENVFDAAGNFTPPEGHSILNGFKIDGVDQKTWLESSLKNSDAKWKVIVSSVIFNPKYYGALKDPTLTKAFPQIQRGVIDKWAGFPDDMNFLINLIKDNDIKNVIMLSGDSHSSYIDDGTNSFIPEISSSNLDTKNSKLGLLTALAGYNIWNQGSFNDDTDAYGRISFHYGNEDYALLEIVDQNGSSVLSYKLIAK